MDAFLVRLLLCGPLLYLGLIMAINPSQVTNLLNDVAVGIQRFDNALRGYQLPDPSYPPPSQGTQRFLRITGCLLIVFAMLHLSGLIP